MSQKTTMQTFGLFLALAVIAASGPFLWQLQVQEKKGGLEVGKPMPAITDVSWVGDPAPDLSGKVVVVNAWFVGCPYCHKGMPDLVKLHNQYRDRDDVVFVGLTYHTEKERRNVEKFVRRYEAEWPNAYAARDTLIEFKADYYPAYWIIDRTGKIVWNRDSSEDMSDALAAATQS